MKNIIVAFITVLLLSIVVLLCFSSCYLASKSDKYWEQVRKELDNKDERR